MMKNDSKTPIAIAVSQLLDLSVPHSTLYNKRKKADVATVKKARNQPMYAHHQGSLPCGHRDFFLGSTVLGKTFCLKVANMVFFSENALESTFFAPRVLSTGDVCG